MRPLEYDFNQTVVYLYTLALLPEVPLFTFRTKYSFPITSADNIFIAWPFPYVDTKTDIKPLGKCARADQ